MNTAQTSNFNYMPLGIETRWSTRKDRCGHVCDRWKKFSRYTNKKQFKFCRHCDKAVPISEVKNARCSCCGYQVKHTTRDGRKY